MNCNWLWLVQTYSTLGNVSVPVSKVPFCRQCSLGQRLGKLHPALWEDPLPARLSTSLGLFHGLSPVPVTLLHSEARLIFTCVWNLIIHRSQILSSSFQLGHVFTVLSLELCLSSIFSMEYADAPLLPINCKFMSRTGSLFNSCRFLFSEAVSLVEIIV